MDKILELREGLSFWDYLQNFVDGVAAYIDFVSQL